MYCPSRFQSRRRYTREVRVGGISLGGTQPVRVQSMTNTPTQDVVATVRQAIALAEAGCEIIRVTAPTKAAAEALRDIHGRFRAAGFLQPLVADIHFLPDVAMEAIEHVEKVRVNPGNYADKKKFAVRTYTDADYAAELERIHEAFSPLVLRAKALGRCLRIGTNHGSLSDRIMNRYGDSPEGMAQSALEFLRICESHSFHDIVLSMKSSNPKVAIQACRIVVERMAAEGMHYPLHLGVTEAGDGDDARIKSAMGIGSLLVDGLGDTIRVSLTEDPVCEIPVAFELARKAMELWQRHEFLPPLPGNDTLDPLSFRRREVEVIHLGAPARVGGIEVPAVVVPWSVAPDVASSAASLTAFLAGRPAARPEAVLLRAGLHGEPAGAVAAALPSLARVAGAVFLDVPSDLSSKAFELQFPVVPGLCVARRFTAARAGELADWIACARARDFTLALDVLPGDLARLAPVLLEHTGARLVLCCTDSDLDKHPVGTHRALAEVANALGLRAPLWLRGTVGNRFDDCVRDRPGRLLDTSMFFGALLCDGLGDLVGVETEEEPAEAAGMAFDILQGARARVVKTEYVACPSCGRTLFDLQTTTQRIRERTRHLKGVTLAIMGCIVNGPGEMADADFGYVGGAPGKVNLYVGKRCVQVNIPEGEAVDRLIALIKEHGRWVEPQDGSANPGIGAT